VVVGVAHTSLYGDIVIGIPYNKRHMFEQDNNHVAASTYKPNFASRHSIANYPTTGPVSVNSNYRRTSYVAPPRKVLYDDDDNEIISKPTRRSVSKKRYEDLEDEVDWPSSRTSVASLRGRAQSLQRQLNGIPEFQSHSYSAGRASSIGPSAAPSSSAAVRSYSAVPASSYSSPASSYSSVPASSYSSPATSSYSGAAGLPPSGMPKQLPRAPKPQMSDARRKVRDLLCKSKNDPHYFDD